MRDWEPRLALVGDGQTEELARAARGVLGPGGTIVLECHAEGAAAIVTVLDGLGYKEATITADLAGRERVVEARWEGR